MNALPHSLADLRGRRCARWTRESTKGQTDRSGPEAQRFAQDEAIERLQLVDTGLAWLGSHSGFDEKAIAESPQWADMLDHAGHDYDVLVVAYASRFCRNGKAGRIAMDDVHARGALVYFAEDDLLIQPGKANPDTDRWFAIMLEDEMYSRKLVRAMERTYKAKFRTHRDPGGVAPLGFRRTGGEPSVLEIDPNSIGLVVSLYERFALGTWTAARLAAETGLHEDRIKPILRNRIYNGYVQRYGEWKPAAWRANPPVGDQLFEQVAALREARSRGGGPRRTGRVDLLNGLLFCRCGQKLWSEPGPQGYRKRHRRPCAAWGATERLMARVWESPLVAQVTGLDLSPGTIADVVAACAAPPALPDELGRRRVEHERADLAHRYSKGKVNAAQFMAEDAALGARLEATEIPTAAVGLQADEVLAYLRNLPALWADAGEKERADLLHAIYQRVEVLGPDVVGVTLTPAALRHGLALALPEEVMVPGSRVGGEGLEPPTFSV